MLAEVISIGDELTSGLSLDTNAQWLSQRMAALGIRVLYHTTVGDELDALEQILRTAIKRVDLVVATGGLGPTADDLTREALARSVDRELVCDETALAHIRALFARRGREMPERNRVQAFFPEGSRVIPNPEGSAPGIATEMVGDDVRPVRVYCLPGVPAEMRQMWDETLEKELGHLIGGDNCRCIRSRRIRCFGAGESAIEAMLPDLIRRGRHPRVGITASEATITLNVTAEGPTEQACLAAMEPTITTIRESLGQLVFGEGEDRLEDAVVRLLRKQGKTLATIEWATEGLVSQWLQTAAMGQEVAGGAVVNRSTPLVRFLRLPGECPSDGEELSRTMAQSWRDCVGADYALAIGPFPGEDSPGQNPDVVFMAMATPENVRSLAVPVASHPSIRTVFCAKCALNVVRVFLLGGPSSA